MPDHASRTVERHCDVAVVGATAAGLAAAAELGRRHRSVILVDAGQPAPAPADEREDVRRHGGEVLDGRVTRGTRADEDHLRLELSGGHAVVARRVLAAAPVEAPTVSGLYVAGDLTDPDQRQVAADGGGIGAAIDADLAAADTAGTRPSANQADWDQRYGGDRMWSGNPNGSLVEEIADLAPGRALDVGAGEGGDALWLAEQGWQVTASDISPLALAHIDAEARRRGLAVHCRHADANALEPPFEPGAFDLVSAHYASIPRTPDDRAVANLLAAVAPGGTLLVVGHDLEPMRAPVDTQTHSRAFDPDAYVRVDDVAAALAGSPAWDVEVHEKRPRPPGAASSHHVDDVVLRARRRAAG